MKRYTYYTLFVLIGSLFSSCDVDDHAHHNYPNYLPSLKGHYLAISKSSLSFSYERSTQDIKVESMSSKWRFSGMPDWVTITPSSGNESTTVAVAVTTENPSADEVRTCVVNLNSDDPDFKNSQTLTISQAKAEPYTSIADEDRNIIFNAAGGSQTININTNKSYTIGYIPSWLTATPSTDYKTLTITTTANESTSERTSTLYINSCSIKVTQRAANISVSSSSTINVEKDGGQYEMKITSDMPWTASAGSYSWISISPESGNAGSTNVTLSIAPNSSTSQRTGRVNFKIGTATVSEVTIQQKGLVLNVSPSSVMFSADACSRTVDVESNTKWKVTSKPEWITVSSETYDGNKTLTLNATANSQTSTRTGTVTLACDGVALSKSITVGQEGRKFDNLVSSLSFTAEPSSQLFSISTDASWTAEASESWVTLSNTSGNGNADVQVSVAENTSDAERTATVTVTAGGTAQTILITQASHYFTIDPTSFSAIPSTGGSHKIQVASDSQWSASKSAEWLTVSPTSGKGNIEVTITAADNPSVYSRTDEVIITPQYGQSVKVVVLQKARYLNVSTSEIYFFYNGGESEPVVIDTDGTYKVSTTDSWLTVKETGKTFTVTATENISNNKREGKITVQLTGLANGESKVIEIPIVQQKEIINPKIEDFSADENWNIYI